MGKSHYIIPIFVSHQGCPHQCVFCNQNKIAKVYEDVTAEDVKVTIESFIETINRNSKRNAIVEVSFFGGTFTAIDVNKQKELLAIAKDYKDKGIIHKIRLSTRPDAINNYILDYLKDYSVDIIELGVQSLNDDVLKKSGRGHSSKDVKIASKLIKDYGFVLGHQIMPGLPGDTFELDIETTKMSIEMKPDIVRIYPSLVIKDTPMEEMYLRGEYIPYTLDEAVEISKKMLKLYEDNKIQVIRIGLQPTDNITEGKDVIAGPFHPAFRELVQSSSIWEQIKKEINSTDNIVIEVNPKDVSKLYANKKNYFNEFKDKHQGSIQIKQNNKIKVSEFEIYIISKKVKIMI